MNKQVREAARAEALEEARREEENLLKTTARLRQFKTATAILGPLLLCDLVLVAQFLVGGRWHKYWDVVGRFVLLLAGLLLPAFAWVATMTFSLWSYLREMTKIYKQYAPPLSKNRTGTRHAP